MSRLDPALHAWVAMGSRVGVAAVQRSAPPPRAEPRGPPERRCGKSPIVRETECSRVGREALSHPRPALNSVTLPNGTRVGDERRPDRAVQPRTLLRQLAKVIAGAPFNGRHRGRHGQQSRCITNSSNTRFDNRPPQAESDQQIRRLHRKRLGEYTYNAYSGASQHERTQSNAARFIVEHRGDV